MNKCTHCGEPTTDTVSIKRKWVSHGRGPVYGGPNNPTPVVLPCHAHCKDRFLSDRARYYSVLDEIVNTHRDFVRVEGQSGYLVLPDGSHLPCEGWQSCNELPGYPEYIPHERYAAYY